MFHFKTNAHSGLEEAPVSHRPSQSEMVSSQHRRSSSFHCNAVSPSSLYGAESTNRSGIFRAKTSDSNNEDMSNFTRTGSGGLLMKCRTSFEGQQQVSQARAAELSALYEMSESKDTNLNRKAIIKQKVTCAPTMGGQIMTAKQAAMKFAKHEADFKARTKGNDPLLTAREIKERKRKESIVRRKAEIKKRNKGKSPIEVTPTSSFENSTPKRVGTSPRHVASYDDYDIFPVAIGLEVVGTKGCGAFSMAPTVAKPRTSNPAKNTGYRAANGIVYYVANLC